jgi:hypothetical protein
MTPNESFQPRLGAAKPAAVLNLLLGIWLFISPWVYGVYSNSNSWNSWIVGALIAIFAMIRLSNPGGLPFFSWLNMLLGAWTIASPWVFSYVNDTPRFVNSLCVGGLVLILAFTAWKATPRLPLQRQM